MTKSLSLLALFLMAGVRSVSLVALSWWRLVRVIVGFHADLCRKSLVWIMAFVSLPARILLALRRETTLEMHLHELQTQWENDISENRALEQQLQRAIKERKVIETVFEEIEVEHEKALSRIDQLENELRDLRHENSQLNKIPGQIPWDYKARDEKITNVHEGIPLIIEDILLQGDPFGDANQVKSRKPAPVCCTQQKNSMNSVANDTLERQRVVALSRSLFSSILSLIVGMIIWEAEDPCMPLVAALFTVVGMSLNSVVQFFSTIKNKPASDAVALLSINWFILGTLTSPALPGIVRMLAPRVLKLADRLVIYHSLSSPVF